jgi:hypothetical protein
LVFKEREREKTVAKKILIKKTPKINSYIRLQNLSGPKKKNCFLSSCFGVKEREKTVAKKIKILNPNNK